MLSLLQKSWLRASFGVEALAVAEKLPASVVVKLYDELFSYGPHVVAVQETMDFVKGLLHETGWYDWSKDRVSPLRDLSAQAFVAYKSSRAQMERYWGPEASTIVETISIDVFNVVYEDKISSVSRNVEDAAYDLRADLCNIMLVIAFTGGDSDNLPDHLQGYENLSKAISAAIRDPQPQKLP